MSFIGKVTKVSAISEGKEYLGKMVWAVIIAGFLLAMLPKSPFQYFYDQLNTLNSLVNLSFVNWFIPFGTCIAIGEAWLVAVSVFYGISYSLRIVKVIGG